MTRVRAGGWREGRKGGQQRGITQSGVHADTPAAAMALFGRDREHEQRGQRPEAAPPPSPAPQEVKMFEREKAQPQETAGTSAFLGKGSRVNGKLAFEGAVRIEGQVEGEIASEDTL